ncbi:MAG: zinc ribbon domain-containing protein [Bacillota bacterium]
MGSLELVRQQKGGSKFRARAIRHKCVKSAQIKVLKSERKKAMKRMQTDLQKLAQWTEEFGLESHFVKDESGREGLRIDPKIAGDIRIGPKEEGKYGISSVVHLPDTQLRELWGVSDEEGEAADCLSNMLKTLETAFPLLRIRSTRERSGLRVEFESPLYTEELNRQTYYLTLSSVIKACETFGIIQAERSRYMQAWTALEESAEHVPEIPEVEIPRCPSCGGSVGVEDRFCGNCGSDLSSHRGEGVRS